MVIDDKWAARLKELADDLNKSTNELFGFEEARGNVSRQVSEAEMLYVSKIKHFIGYIDSLI